MKPIYLIGFMGSGKTTLGRALAIAARLRFIDLDEAIEQRSGNTIPRLFDTIGEPQFRILETETLKSLSNMYDVIIACGGGTPCHADNISLMNRTGITVHLHASIKTLLRRLSDARASRPLIAAITDDNLPQYIRNTLNDRLPFYSRAAIQFASDHLESETQIAESVSKIAHLLSLPLAQQAKNINPQP